PPMYSALKKDGRRLYELARAGIEVEREPRPVHIAELTLLRFEPGRAAFHVRCSKGTYVRTLVEDIARAAGTLGYVTALRRPAVEPFREEQMMTLSGLEERFAAEGLTGLD